MKFPLNFQLFRDADLKTNFDQQETYKVLLDLLYENKRYEEIYECYQVIRSRLELFERFPFQTLNCFVFAACYHLVSVQ